MQLIARVWPEDGGFVAECVELRVVSQGDTEDGAVANLVAVAKPHHPAFFHKIVCLVGEKMSVYL